MIDQAELTPTELIALEIAHRTTGRTFNVARRFTTGIAHWVYEVSEDESATMVVRVGSVNQGSDFVGAVRWSKALRPLGVPLPELLAHGEHRGLPYVVLERLPGQDLESVYGALSRQQLGAVARAVNEPDYTDHGCSLLDLTTEQLAALDFYTALFCVDFIGEVGQTFNGNAAFARPERIAPLEALVLRLLGALQ